MITTRPPLHRLGVVARRRRRYYGFVIPALVVIGAVIVFPWLFTLWMSAFDWTIGREAHFVGFDNYAALASNQRFLEAVARTFYFTVLAVIAPLVHPCATPRTRWRRHRARSSRRSNGSRPW